MRIFSGKALFLACQSWRRDLNISSGTPTPTFSDRGAMNGIWDQARPLPDSARSSLAVYRLACVADVMMSASDRSSISVGDSCCKEQASVSEPSPSGLGQKPE